MRIAILSIAFLLLAFAAQSQVLKSAGVWYFLDVDSMAARPAVLPNGTELAYVVGTKKIYNWHRGTSTWAEYGGGSTFNRDSIYFDTSIIGSGTVGDPWGVDSTLFATIAGVGDSIAAAVGYVAANFFPLQGGTLTGTGGNGFVGFPLQSSPPSTPATGFSLFAGSTGNNISWMQPDGFFRRLVSPMTGTPRQYQFMARSYTLADSADVAALPTGSGTTNYYTKWTSSTALGIGNMTDNNTVVSILNSKPFSLGQWTTAGRPAGTTGYMGYNTTGNGIEWYQGTRWAYALESTFARGTSTYVPFFDANGQMTEGIATGQGLRYYNAGGNLHILEAKSAIEAKGVTGINSGNGDLVVSSATSAGGRWSFSVLESSGAFSFYDAISAQTPVTIAKNSGNARININSVTTALSGASLLTGTVGSTVQTIGNATDAIGGTGTWRVLNGSNIFSITPTGTSPYFAFTNGTQRGYFQATVLDGVRMGSITNHPIVFVTNSTTKAYITGTGRFGIAKAAPDYILDATSTDAYGLPRGTVAQRPTIVASTTPIRYNTDSTALEYGESVGTWRQLATRAYARSLPTIYTANGTLTGNRILTGAGNRLDLLGLSRFKADSMEYSNFTLAVRNNTTGSSMAVGGGGNFPGNFTIQDRNSGGSQILKTYMELDKRRSTFGYQWNLNETWQLPSGGFAWTRHAKFDTVGVDRFQVIYGSDFADVPTSHVFKASGAAGLSEPLFRVFAQNTNATVVAKIDINAVGDIANFNMDRSIQFSDYGTSAKEAADLSKTQSNYIAGFATDGTLLDYPISSLATTWLKPELESVGNVKISTTNSLTFKQGTTRWTGSSEQLGTSITPGNIYLRKTSAGDFGATLHFGDTLGVVDNDFYFEQDNRLLIQAEGSGAQLNLVASSSKLPGTFRWPYGVRVDTSSAIGELMIVHGDKYASTTTPITQRFYAGIQDAKTIPGFQFTSTGASGKMAFNVNNVLNIRQNGKVYIGQDSTLKFDPANDLLQLSEYDGGAKTAPALGIESSEMFLNTGTGGVIVNRKIRETTWTNSNASVTDDMLELTQDVFVYANCPAIATDSTVIDLPTPSVDYIGQIIEVCGDGRSPTYNVYVRGVGATLWHQNGGADPSAQTYLEVTNLSSNHNTVRFICAQPSGSTYYWILLKQ